MKDGTRQVGQTLEEIRRDHTQRYLFASQRIPSRAKVLDLACGCGYGSWILHSVGLEVTGADISSEAISFAEQHYPGPAYLCQKAEEASGDFDAFVTFETLEHLDEPERLLKSVHAPLVIASVPNENVMPYSAEKFLKDKFPHKRHYTPQQFNELLESCGLKVIERYCQLNKYGDIVPGSDGLFLINVCSRLP